MKHWSAVAAGHIRPLRGNGIPYQDINVLMVGRFGKGLHQPDLDDVQAGKQTQGPCPQGMIRFFGRRPLNARHESLTSLDRPMQLRVSPAYSRCYAACSRGICGCRAPLLHIDR